MKTDFKGNKAGDIEIRNTFKIVFRRIQQKWVWTQGNTTDPNLTWIWVYTHIYMYVRGILLVTNCTVTENQRDCGLQSEGSMAYTLPALWKLFVELLSKTIITRREQKQKAYFS